LAPDQKFARSSIAAASLTHPEGRFLAVTAELTLNARELRAVSKKIAIAFSETVRRLDEAVIGWLPARLLSSRLASPVARKRPRVFISTC